MGSLKRKLDRKNEKEKLIEIHKTYNKKPKQVCPKCHRKSLFMTNSKKEVYCIRCDKMVAISK
jgi:ribosomal protein S27AE